MRTKKLIIGTIIAIPLLIGIVIGSFILYNLNHAYRGRYVLKTIEFESFAEFEENFLKLNSVNYEGEFNLFPLDDLPLSNIKYGIDGVYAIDEPVDKMFNKAPFVYGESSSGCPIAIGYRRKIETLDRENIEWVPEAYPSDGQSRVACRDSFKEGFQRSYSYPLIDGNRNLILVLTIFFENDSLKNKYYTTETIPDEAKEVTEFLLNKF